LDKNLEYRNYYDKHGIEYFKLRSEKGLIFNESIEFPAVLKMLEKNEINSATKILDIGCGFGFYSKYFASVGAHITALDASKQMIELAKEYCAGCDNIIYVNDLFENADLQDEFDIVLGNFMLSYFDDLDHLFNKVRRIVKPDSTMVFSMLHPIVQSKLSRNDKGYLLDDYFGNEFFESDFLNKEDKISLHKKSLNEIFLSAKRNNLYVEEIDEPKLVATQGMKNVLAEFYSRCPSMMIFKLRPLNRTS
jgi:2-polyprenyl-3-methyl-5-hydroxy-6-metoxy-1,4-benzoquinol methylase